MTFENTWGDLRSGWQHLRIWTSPDYWDPAGYNWEKEYPAKHFGGNTSIYADGHAKTWQVLRARGRDFVFNESPEPRWTGW
jgi:hypothetical protein